MVAALSEKQRTNITVCNLARHIFRLGKKKVSVQDLPLLLQQLCPENKKEAMIEDHPDQEFTLKFYEAIGLLKRRGLLMNVIDGEFQGSSLLGLPIHSVRPTSIWEKSSFDDDGVIILIDDAQEIVNSLKEKVPELDPVVEQYYLESLRACQEGLYISSVICLGAASEKTIDCLVQAVTEKYSEHGKKLEKRRSISAQIKYLSDKKNFRPIFGSIEDEMFKNEIKEKLSGIAHIYRRNRNEAGHPGPISMDITRDEQQCYLNSFRRYAMIIFEAIRMLKSNPL